MMDETSSNLDRQGEQELYNTLIELAKDHTVIVITHSQALLAASQQVLVLQRGKIVRSGKPQDVLPELLGARAAAGAAPRRSFSRHTWRFGAGICRPASGATQSGDACRACARTHRHRSRAPCRNGAQDEFR